MRTADKAVEARAGGAKIRHDAWMAHKYDCNLITRWNKKTGQAKVKKRFKSMQPCSLFAMQDHLWGETYRVMDYEITDGHY